MKKTFKTLAAALLLASAFTASFTACQDKSVAEPQTSSEDGDVYTIVLSGASATRAEGSAMKIGLRDDTNQDNFTATLLKNKEPVDNDGITWSWERSTGGSYFDYSNDPLKPYVCDIVGTSVSSGEGVYATAVYNGHTIVSELATVTVVDDLPKAKSLTIEAKKPSCYINDPLELTVTASYTEGKADQILYVNDLKSYELVLGEFYVDDDYKHSSSTYEAQLLHCNIYSSADIPIYFKASNSEKEATKELYEYSGSSASYCMSLSVEYEYGGKTVENVVEFYVILEPVGVKLTVSQSELYGSKPTEMACLQPALKWRTGDGSTVYSQVFCDEFAQSSEGSLGYDITTGMIYNSCVTPDDLKDYTQNEVLSTFASYAGYSALNPPVIYWYPND